MQISGEWYILFGLLLRPVYSMEAICYSILPVLATGLRWGYGTSHQSHQFPRQSDSPVLLYSTAHSSEVPLRLSASCLPSALGCQSNWHLQATSGWAAYLKGSIVAAQHLLIKVSLSLYHFVVLLLPWPTDSDPALSLFPDYNHALTSLHCLPGSCCATPGYGFWLRLCLSPGLSHSDWSPGNDPWLHSCLQDCFISSATANPWLFWGS